MSETLEPYLELEARLIGYLQSLQKIPGNPLTDVEIYPGHSEADLDNVPSWISVYAERSDTQTLESGGLEIVDVQTMVSTSADDTALAVHNARVAGMRAVYALQNLPQLLSFVNAVAGFGLSGFKAGKPPLQDGFDTAKRRRQAMFRHMAVCGLELS